MTSNALQTERNFLRVFWFTIANLADAVSSVLVFSIGGYESNPLPALFATNYIGFILFKLVAGLAIAGLVWRLDKAIWLRIPTFMFLVFTFWNMLIYMGSI